MCFISFCEQFRHWIFTVTNNGVMNWVAEVSCPDMWSGAETCHTDRSIQRCKLRYGSIIEPAVSLLKVFDLFKEGLSCA